MARESIKARQRKREKMVANYADRRAALKASAAEALKNDDFEASMEFRAKLDKLPKNSSKVRLKNRCQITGRPKGYMSFFGISRVLFREMALNGKIPGVKKASW
jgi:small subunit ribosomal protein S14